ncbi:heterotrimeric G protein alpha subunit [Mycena galopus ATCC 62051]|nr:heterotrimeric G protein alpha subunit [Mycena galopus ATCC 62051]
MSAFTPTENDPFYEIMRPPADETPAQMTARLKREADAQRISDNIDEDIKRDRAQQRKSRKELRILLLGQGESGKSTTLKNFRMQYAREAWEKERTGWRAVVQLNIVRSIILILEIMEAEMSGNGTFEGDDDEIEVVHRHRDSTSSGADAFTDKHRMLLIRLAPLRGLEADLKRRLGAGAEPVHPSAPMYATPFDEPAPVPSPKRSPEFFVRSWTDAIEPTLDHDSSTITLMTCKEDMQALWADPAVQLALERRKVRLADTAGFFLNDLERIATREYAATDDDIVRARLRTVGIQEYLLRISDGFSLLGGGESYWTWKLYDVGGCRTMRTAWLPFFENTDVIIFLCPVSCFDERLDEDTRVNRLEDSTLLWRSICTSKLLSKTQLILFLNKCDLLKRKLKRGIKLKTFLPSYGDRPNEVMPVVKYLREKYKEIQKQHSPEPRVAYIYTTTVTDTTATAKTLHSIRDRVLRENLVTSNLV